MKKIFSWCFGLLWVACATDPGAKPLGVDVPLRLATTGEGVFEENVHSLVIYAFRKAANGEYLYDRTLARWGETEIKALGNSSSGKKMFSTRLTVGEYELYFMANALGNYTGIPQQRVTRPSDIVLTLPAKGVDSIYFLGKCPVRVGAELVQPLSVTLNRAVSRADVTINGIPEPIDSVTVSVGSLTTGLAIDGSKSPEMTSVVRRVAVDNRDVYRKDTARFTFLTFPTARGQSEVEVSFLARSGDRKTGVISAVVLKPDGYVQLTGEVNDAPGAFLSFDVTYQLVILDDWKNFPLPDFVLEPYEP